MIELLPVLWYQGTVHLLRMLWLDENKFTVSLQFINSNYCQWLFLKSSLKHEKLSLENHIGFTFCTQVLTLQYCITTELTMVKYVLNLPIKIVRMWKYFFHNNFQYFIIFLIPDLLKNTAKVNATSNLIYQSYRFI